MNRFDCKKVMSDTAVQFSVPISQLSLSDRQWFRYGYHYNGLVTPIFVADFQLCLRISSFCSFFWYDMYLRLLQVWANGNQIWRKKARSHLLSELATRAAS